jgi:hypothetical protein
MCQPFSSSKLKPKYACCPGEIDWFSEINSTEPWGIASANARGPPKSITSAVKQDKDLRLDISQNPVGPGRRSHKKALPRNCSLIALALIQAPNVKMVPPLDCEPSHAVRGHARWVSNSIAQLANCPDQLVLVLAIHFFSQIIDGHINEIIIYSRIGTPNQINECVP